MAGTITTLKDSNTIVDNDYKAVKYVGKTKGGNVVTIEIPNAICISDPEWTFAEKDDVVASLEFEGCYDDTTLASDRTAPFTIKIDGTITSGAGEIVLGVGKFYIGNTAVALTRGGGSFKVEHEIREINADGDPGKVKGRVVNESARPKLTMNVLTFLTRVTDIYPGMITTTTTA